MKRSSGILMHISSLPSAYGIGNLGREAYAFIDFLKKANRVIRTEAFQCLLYPCSISSMVTFHREISVAQIAFSVSCL